MKIFESTYKFPENLTIVNAMEFINSLNNSFPLQKFIEGFLPDDMKFSLDNEIRLDKDYVTKMIEMLPLISVADFEDLLSLKIENEISTLLPQSNKHHRWYDCLQLAASYDLNFQVGLSKYFLSDETKNHVINITSTILETANRFINKVILFIFLKENSIFIKNGAFIQNA